MGKSQLIAMPRGCCKDHCDNSAGGMSHGQGASLNRRFPQRRFARLQWRAHRHLPARMQAPRDALTGLPDRRWLQARLAAKIENRPAQSIALLLLDLDDFRSINDGAGHDHGDALLVQVVARLRRVLPVSALLTRMGGDAFCVAIAGVSAQRLEALGQQLLQAFSAPFLIAGFARYSSCSLGGAMYPDDAVSAGELVCRADMALFQAKRFARGGMRRFAPDFVRGANERLELQALLREALRSEGQFSLHLQPQMDLPSGRVSGVEALLRWTHPIRGDISPNDFIPVAEAAGLIGAVGDWVLNESCRIARALRDGGCPLRVAINFSALQLRNEALVEQVKQALARHALPPDAIEIELTESALIEDAARAAKSIAELSEFGVRTTIDDFGTGFSSLSYLCSLPVRAIKIDRSFVQQMSDSVKGTRVVQGLIHLAHSLGLSVLAEGVETEAQLALLRSLGCDAFQGWFASKPMPLNEIMLFLEHQPKRISESPPTRVEC